MSEVQVLRKEDMDAILADIQSKIEASKPDMTGFARLSDIATEIEKAKLVKVNATIDGKKVDAELKDSAHAGVMGGITDIKVWEVPIGQALVGGFVAVIASEMVDGFLAKQGGQLRGIVKLVSAGAAYKWGQGVLGTAGATAVALLLTYDGLRSLLPIDEWANKLAGGVTKLTGQGLGGKAGMAVVNPVHQAEKVASDYYAKAMGRR